MTEKSFEQRIQEAFGQLTAQHVVLAALVQTHQNPKKLVAAIRHLDSETRHKMKEILLPDLNRDRGLTHAYEQILDVLVRHATR